MIAKDCDVQDQLESILLNKNWEENFLLQLKFCFNEFSSNHFAVFSFLFVDCSVKGIYFSLFIENVGVADVLLVYIR